jgi:purine-cytosine permease-like protein
MDKFSQNKFFVKKSFLFKDDGVEMFTKEIDGEYSKFIQYSVMLSRSNTRIYTEKFPRILQAGIIISAFSVIRIMFGASDSGLMIGGIFFGMGILAILAYFIFRIKYYLVELEDNTQMFIILNQPSEEKMQAFVDELYSRRRNFYRENYFYINYKKSREDQINKMDWLKSENIITDNEYNVVIDEINERLE